MWLEHLLFGACPRHETLGRSKVWSVCEYFQSFLHTTVRTAENVRLPPEGLFIDNTERKDQRGKEKQKEKSVINLE